MAKRVAVRFTQEEALEIVELYEENDMSFAGIARHFGAPRSTVRDTYFRVKHGLAGKFKASDGPAHREKQPDLDLGGVILKEGIKVVKSGPNKMEISNDVTRGGAWIHTEDQLLEYGEVDLDEWVVVGQKLKAWPGWRADKKVDLSWRDGRATGTIRDDGGISTKQLISVHLTLLRKKPIAVFPVIRPVTPARNWELPPIPRSKNKIYTSLIACDWQVGFNRSIENSTLEPFHDRRVLDIMLQLAGDVQPDRIDLLGDILDLPEWSSKFPKEPEFYWTTQPSIYECHWWLSNLRRTLPDTAITIFEGNHEKRMPDAVRDHIPAAHKLTPADMDIPVMSLELLLGLKGLGIRWLGGYPNNIDWLGSSIALIHGNIARANPGDTAKAVAQGSSTPVVIYGHAHKLELVGWVHDGSRFEEYLVDSFSPGCCCRVDYVVPGHKRGQLWRQGLAVVQYTMQGHYQITPIPIRDGVTMYNGKVYKARSDTMLGLQKAFPGYRWTDSTKD